MKHYCQASILLLLISLQFLSANNINSFQFRNDSIQSTSTDTTFMYRRGSDGLIIVPPSGWKPFDYNVSFNDTVIYDPAFLPVIFDGKMLPSNLDFVRHKDKVNKNEFHLISPDSTFVPRLEKSEFVDQRRKKFYTENLDKIHYSSSDLKSIPKINDPNVTKRNVLNELISADDPVQISPVEMQKIDHGFIYWTKTGEHALQISQSYLSNNWPGGGRKSFYIKNYHKTNVDYKKEKIEFHTTFEWKLNLQQTPADTLHKISIDDDLFRIYSTLGHKAFIKKWTYTANLEMTTPIFNKYGINSKDRKAALFSPLRLTVGLGMNYAFEKKFASNKYKKIKLVQNIAPLAVDYRYVRDDKVKINNSFEKTDLTLGSSLNTDFKFDFNRFMSWTSRFKYLTNYERVEVEFENSYNMALNRYLSAKIYYYLRFDDNSQSPKAAWWGYFQRNQSITFGLNYKW